MNKKMNFYSDGILMLKCFSFDGFFRCIDLENEFNINLFKNSTFFRNSLHPKNFSLSLHPSKCVLWGELYFINKQIKSTVCQLYNN